MNKPFLELMEKYQVGPGMNDALYANNNGLPTPKLYTGKCGSVGAGWVPVLDKLFEKLVALGWDRQIAQIKEKCGNLRVYLNSYTPEMRAAIEEAEAEASETCEVCGIKGSFAFNEIKSHCEL
jgi:hypothetical protein